MLTNWTHIIIHHSLTEDGSTVSWDDIKSYHMRALGMVDIGYNFGIEFIENEYQILYGRSLLIPGAHTLGMNGRAIGICCVGNYDINPPDDRLIIKLEMLLKDLIAIFDISPENIKRHSDYADYKTCPGIQFDLTKINI